MFARVALQFIQNIRIYKRNKVMKAINVLVVGLFALGMGQSVLAADVAAGEAKFKQLCASCHGASGKSDGPISAAMQPKPADMSSSDWQSSVDDDYLIKIIRDGGPSVGKSPMMSAWGHALKGEDLDNVVAYIRSMDD
jgi:mono/diheme cytochrome c family protein